MHILTTMLEVLEKLAATSCKLAVVQFRESHDEACWDLTETVAQR